MKAGDVVRVLHPFAETYAGEYVVASVNPDGVVFLEGIDGGFDQMYLEVV